MGDLEHDSDTVTHSAARVLACPVLEFFNDRQGVIHDGVFGDAIYLDDSSNSACVVFSVV